MGIRVNLAKSNLDPSKHMTYLGIQLDSSVLKAFPTEERQLKLIDLTSKFLSRNPISTRQSL